VVPAFHESAASVAATFVVWPGAYRGLQSKKLPPRPFECFVSQAPFAQQAVPPSQHWPSQPPVGPVGQWQAPATHVPPAHAMHALPQRSWPVGHAQLPPVHVALAGQAFPQAPQFCGSVASFTQAAGQVSGSDVGHPQAPPEQISFASGQTFPQPPQFDGSFAVFTHAVGDEVGHGVGKGARQAQTPPEQPSFVSGHA
jgi:hypothetical protein